MQARWIAAEAAVAVVFLWAGIFGRVRFEESKERPEIVRPADVAEWPARAVVRGVVQATVPLYGEGAIPSMIGCVAWIDTGRAGLVPVRILAGRSTVTCFGGPGSARTAQYIEVEAMVAAATCERGGCRRGVFLFATRER